MKLTKTIKLSFRQLLINRSKSFFAMTGLSVGVAAVITMVAIGNGAREETLRQLDQMGTNLITVNAGKVKKVMERRDQTDLVTTLRMKDCEAILSGCPSVKAAVPSLDGMVKVKYGNTTTKCMINGVSTDYFKVKNFTVAHGDVFSQTDDKLCRRVTVLGGQVNETLFGNENPVGNTVFIQRIPFTIVGVLKSKGVTADGANVDAQVIIPVNTALRRIFNADYLRRIFIEVTDKGKMKASEDEIISVLRETHRLDFKGKENDFTIDNQLNDIQAAESSARSFTWLIAGVSAIALLVGGIGILAVMLLSVRERNEEIGLRLSVGAKRRDIVWQFLTESAILGFAGGFIGFMTGFIISTVVKYTSQWQISISPASVIISLLFSVAIGLVFGVLPARKASQSDPILALQKE
ncbi:MAG TPA: ABC transporter permease [Bacteroidales bacterium]